MGRYRADLSFKNIFKNFRFSYSINNLKYNQSHGQGQYIFFVSVRRLFRFPLIIYGNLLNSYLFGHNFIFKFIWFCRLKSHISKALRNYTIEVEMKCNLLYNFCFVSLKIVLARVDTVVHVDHTPSIKKKMCR